MKLSIIIVSYNVRDYLLQCLDSLNRALNGIDAEIIVVDNHSKDSTPETVATCGYNVRLIACRHNNGFAKANNMAIRQAGGEYVLLINPDTFVGEDTLHECISFMDAHRRAGGLGVMMLKSDGGKALESRRGCPTPMTSFYKMSGMCARFPNHKRFGRYYMCGMAWDEPGRIEIISGAFMMMRKSALDKTGLLDEDFFMYGEDIDLSYRLLKAGYENWYLPAKILHYKGESTQKSSFKYVHVFYQAMLIFFRKHYSHISFWLYLPIKAAIYIKATTALARIMAGNISKMLGFTAKRRNVKSRYVFLGTARALARCKEIADRNGLTAEYLECDEKSNKDGHTRFMLKADKENVVYAVYDTDAYKYSTILNIFQKNNNEYIQIGTYNDKTKMIITAKETIS